MKCGHLLCHSAGESMLKQPLHFINEMADEFSRRDIFDYDRRIVVGKLSQHTNEVKINLKLVPRQRRINYKLVDVYVMKFTC